MARRGARHPLGLLAECHRRRGEVEPAVENLRESLAIVQSQGVVSFVAEPLYTIAGLLISQNAPGAALLVGAAESHRAETGVIAFDPFEDKRTQAALDAALGAPTFSDLQLEGAALSSDEAISLALSCLD